MDSFTHKLSIPRGTDYVKETWNIIEINEATILKKIESIPGINITMLHSGGLFTHFPVHVENDDLLSASYLYSRKPKIWYVAAPLQCEEFEAFNASIELNSDYVNEYDSEVDKYWR